ncbi:hypothetical protein IGI04_029944, partial [Brassica rapa subsp. trilocularis]
ETKKNLNFPEVPDLCESQRQVTKYMRKSLRKSVAIITRDHKSFGRKGCHLKFLSAKNSESKKFSPMLLDEDSLYTSSKHKNGDILFFPIFTIIFKTSVFIRGNLTFILPCGPNVNRDVVYGLLVKKSQDGPQVVFDENAWTGVVSVVPMFGRARSLRSDQTLARAWSPRIDRAWLVRGLISILELVRGRFGYMSVAFGQSVFSGSIEIWTRFYCKALRKDIFTKITFRKNVYADFYGLSDIDSVVTDFDPNIN